MNDDTPAGPAPVDDWQRVLAEFPPRWEPSHEAESRTIWAGLELHVRWLGGADWSWEVLDCGVRLAEGTGTDIDVARQQAEASAREYLGPFTPPPRRDPRLYALVDNLLAKQPLALAVLADYLAELGHGHAFVARGGLNWSGGIASALLQIGAIEVGELYHLALTPDVRVRAIKDWHARTGR